MKRTQIYLTEEMEAAIAIAARRGRTTKAAIIRGMVERCLAADRSPGIEYGEDPIDRFVGAFDGDPVDDIDEVIYGRSR
jgi:hypothetical protein